MAIGAHGGLEPLPVYTGPIVAFVPTSHPLARRKSVCLWELADESWIMVDHKPSSDFRDYLIQMCWPAGFTPNFGRNTTSSSVVFALVAAGEGVALLPELVVLRILAVLVWYRRTARR